MKLFFVLQSIAFFSVISASLGAREVSVMTYNVENLFDPEDDPLYSDEEFTPEGQANWTYEKFELKMKKLAEVITAYRNPDKSLCPDVLALVEVENRKVLEHWRRTHLKQCGYEVISIHRQSSLEPVQNDRRGIKVALMSKVPLGGQPVTYMIYEGTRFILEVPLQVNGQIAYFYVNHWKSRAGGGEEKRAKAAEVLLQILRARNADPLVDIIVLGDFNDEPEDSSLSDILKVSSSFDDRFYEPEEVFLWNVAFDDFIFQNQMQKAKELVEQGRDINLESFENMLRQRRGTYYFSRNRSFHQFDQIMISRGLFDKEGWSYIENSYSVFRPSDFKNENGSPKRFGFRDGRAWGASDHFPVVARFRVGH